MEIKILISPDGKDPYSNMFLQYNEVLFYFISIDFDIPSGVNSLIY